MEHQCLLFLQWAPSRRTSNIRVSLICRAIGFRNSDKGGNSMNKSIEIIITALISGGLTLWGTQIKARSTREVQEVESIATTESIYIENMETILVEYKQQLSEVRDEVAGLKEENREIRKQIRRIKDEHRKELNEYKKYTQLLETENEELKDEVETLKYELITLEDEKE